MDQPANTIILGIGDLGVSNRPDAVIKTFALGSCVAVIFLHPATRTVGMVHVALPECQIDPAKARIKPGYFADTGIPALIRAMTGLGCPPNGRGTTVKMAGGAKIMDPNNTFNIGKRNILAIKKALWTFGMGPIAEDVGGHISRTVTVSIDTGEIIISSSGRGEWKI